jgi:hypothetical protein
VSNAEIRRVQGGLAYLCASLTPADRRRAAERLAGSHERKQRKPIVGIRHDCRLHSTSVLYVVRRRSTGRKPFVIVNTQTGRVAARAASLVNARRSAALRNRRH